MKREFEIIAEVCYLNNSSVLDVGCGDGVLMKFLSKEKNIDVRGLELDEEECSRFAYLKGCQLLRVMLKQSLNQFPDKSFDLCYFKSNSSSFL